MRERSTSCHLSLNTVDLMDDAIKEGAYTKQVGSKSRLISWSHGARFRIGLELSGAFAGKRVLDYGCGDGMYLALLMESATPPAKAVGAEVANDLIESNRRRFGEFQGLEFCTTSALKKAEFAGAFDAVVCMEVLEQHADLDGYLEEFDRLLAPGGTLLISVPVDRLVSGDQADGSDDQRMARCRGLSGNYSVHVGELWKAVWAGEARRIERPFFTKARMERSCTTTRDSTGNCCGPR